MPLYHVQTASWPDITYLQSLCADALRNSPLTNAILSDPQHGYTNSFLSRSTFAYYIYLQAFQAQYASKPFSKVLKVVNTQRPGWQIQACCWLQWIPPNPSMDMTWRDGPISRHIMRPPCLNWEMYRHLEKAKHFHRNVMMRGNAHYCAYRFAPLNHPRTDIRFNSHQSSGLWAKHRGHDGCSRIVEPDSYYGRWIGCHCTNPTWARETLPGSRLAESRRHSVQGETVSWPSSISTTILPAAWCVNIYFLKSRPVPYLSSTLYAKEHDTDIRLRAMASR